MKKSNFTSRGKKVLTAVGAVIMAAVLSFECVPVSAAAKAKTKNPYAGYTELDMSNFKKGNAIYSEDGTWSTLFSNKVSKSSNQHKTSFGALYVNLGSADQMYFAGEITFSNLKSVLMNHKKYINGNDGHYIVTGVYDNSGITYTRSPTSSYEEKQKQTNSIFKSIYSKGFKNNTHSKSLTFCNAELCTKIANDGSDSKIGYVRAIVVTFKKIS